MTESPTKGISKHWTPAQEALYSQSLATCKTFAQRDLVISVRDLLKYDLRTKAGKRALTRGQLRIAVATDEDIEEMASIAIAAENEKRIKEGMTIEELLPLQEANVKDLKKLRAKIRLRGIKRSELECR